MQQRHRSWSARTALPLLRCQRGAVVFLLQSGGTVGDLKEKVSHLFLTTRSLFGSRHCERLLPTGGCSYENHMARLKASSVALRVKKSSRADGCMHWDERGR